jgi:hypothetical protein
MERMGFAVVHVYGLTETLRPDHPLPVPAALG